MRFFNVTFHLEKMKSLSITVGTLSGASMSLNSFVVIYNVNVRDTSMQSISSSF
jgi:hypothetical protein